MAMKMVGIDTKYIDITDTMKIVFRQAISNDNHPSIEEMNNRVIERLINKLESSIERQKTFTKRTFVNGNIPSNMLARPSMSIERQDDDESRGKFTIELQR
jgi:membrane protease subunit (stomatin/prohibitin family)